MTRPQLVVIALVYVAALVLGMRAVGALLPQAQETGFVVAALAAGITAAVFVHRRRPHARDAGAKLTVGVLMAALAVLVGLICQPLWQPMARPVIALPVAAVATLASPWVIFPLVRRALEDSAPGAADAEIGEFHVVVTLISALLVITAAGFIPVPGRSNVRLVGQHYPSLFIGLPQWEAEQNQATMTFGSIKLRDPRGGGDRFLAVRWMDSPFVQPDEHVQSIAVGGLNVRDRSPAFVSRHEGVTFYLESDDRLNRAAATIWNCPQDHRVLWIFSYLAGPKSAMLATHRNILKYVRCHTGQNKAAATTQAAIYPAFAPPPGFIRDEQAGTAAVYTSGSGAVIVFDAAVAGTADLVVEDVPPDIVGNLLVSGGMLQEIAAPPRRIDVTDLLGHPRRVWSVSGTIGSGRRPVHMEVMAWHCDVRNMTFIGRYASPQEHEPREGVEALLPAVCHQQ